MSRAAWIRLVRAAPAGALAACTFSWLMSVPDCSTCLYNALFVSSRPREEHRLLRVVHRLGRERLLPLRLLIRGELLRHAMWWRRSLLLGYAMRIQKWAAQTCISSGSFERLPL
jgi:hypothetical protein